VGCVQRRFSFSNISLHKLAQICKNNKIHRLALFSSALRGEFKPDSDIDLLVEFKPSHAPSFFKMFRQKMQKYYADKEESIWRVAVDNIREAKIRELEQDRREKRLELDRRCRLIPSLERLQIAYVEFDQ